MTTPISGTTQPFDILWDSNGLVHIYAANVADAYRGMGYAAGYERLWQIHLSTLYATGTAASVMGQRFITQDLVQQAFNVPAYDMPDSPGDWLVDAYLDGLNSYIRALPEVPAEFLRAGITPREFTRHDVASRHRFTGWFQHKTVMEKIYTGKLMARHGVDWFRNMVRRFSQADEESIGELQDALQSLDPRVGNLLFPNEQISGSNNWAISGQLSASGKPMLATDPHQPHSIPNTFFYVHLSAPGWDAFGATFPGTPYFMMGFNQDIAWGLTTGFIDTYDVFVERDADFQKRQIPISVAGQADQTFEISVSENGPILESLTDALGITQPVARDYWTSLYWVMRNIPTSAGTLASLPLAKTSKEFGDGLFENNICPLVNNLICVDQGNDLRRFIAATIPKRSGVTGTVPLPGWRSEYKFELSSSAELLVEHNPACGFALTANNDTMGDRGDYPIHNFPTFSSRADRIRELLEHQGSNFSKRDFENMQLDQKDLKALDWVPGIISCLTDQSEQVQRARQLLSDWNFDAGTDSKAACIFYPLMDKRWHIRFMHEILGDDLLLSQPVVAPALNRFGVSDFMQPGSPWLSHRNTLERIISDTVKQLVTNLDREFGSNWTWGQLQYVNFWHSLRKHAPWDNMKAGPDPIGGSGTTLCMALHEPATNGTEKVRVYHGPAFRWVVDLADPLHFRFVIAGGNSGRSDSRNITDHYNHWLQGKYYDISLVRNELDISNSLHFDPA